MQRVLSLDPANDQDLRNAAIMLSRITPPHISNYLVEDFGGQGIMRRLMSATRRKFCYCPCHANASRCLAPATIIANTIAKIILSEQY